MDLLLSSLLALICGIILSVLFLKLYIIINTKWSRSPVCLVGKTTLVTGSNIGIGYYTALDFAERGARVILACRNEDKAEAAKAKIIEATGNRNVVVKVVDLSSFTSIRKFAKEINKTEDRLDILVNNAGIGGFKPTLTDDGLSLSLQTNHFGPFLLTILLLDLLKKSTSGRIVVVASSAAAYAKLNIDDLNRPFNFFPELYEYFNAKLCNILFTIELANKLKGTTVTVNAVNPGVVKSDFHKNAPNLLARIIKIAMKLLYKDTQAGAQTSIHVSVAKELNGVSGKYFEECSVSEFPRKSNDKALAKILWDKSEELVKLTAEEKFLFNK